MLTVSGYTITIPRGDTGAFRGRVPAEYNGAIYEYTANDRVVFTARSGQGVFKQEICEIEDGYFTIYFVKNDTYNVPTGACSWDIAVYIHPYYDDAGNIVNADQITTPIQMQTLNILPIARD